MNLTILFEWKRNSNTYSYKNWTNVFKFINNYFYLRNGKAWILAKSAFFTIKLVKKKQNITDFVIILNNFDNFFDFKVNWKRYDYALKTPIKAVEPNSRYLIECLLFLLIFFLNHPHYCFAVVLGPILLQ